MFWMLCKWLKFLRWIKYLEMIKIVIFFFWINDFKKNESYVKIIKKRLIFVCFCDEWKVFY